MTPEDIQRMFDEMGLGTEEQRAAYRCQPQPEPAPTSEQEPSEMIFIRTDCISVVLDK